MATEIVLLIMLLVQSACLVAVTIVLLRRSERGGMPDRVWRQIVSTLQEDQARLATLDERLQGLRPLAQSVGHIRDGITEMQSRIRAREDMERRTGEAIRRLEHVISGTQTRGAAGENLLDNVFRQLPTEWQVRNLRVGNKVVEFGLRLPNGLLLPIDCKWAATPLLEQLDRTDDPSRRLQIKALLEATVLARAKEVRKYVDPNLTVGYGVAVVPDPVYELCGGIQAEAFAGDVVIIGQSLFLPYLLLVFQTVLKSSQTVDIQRFDLYVNSCQQDIAAMQEELEGRFSRATTMLENSRREIAGGLARVQGELTSLRRNAEVLAVSDGAGAEASTASLAYGLSTHAPDLDGFDDDDEDYDDFEPADEGDEDADESDAVSEPRAAQAYGAAAGAELDDA